MYIASVLNRAPIENSFLLDNLILCFHVPESAELSWILNSPHISSNINATTELSTFTNKRDLQLAKPGCPHRSKWWLTAHQSKWKQPANDFMSLYSLQFHLRLPWSSEHSQADGCSKVRDKDLVFPLGMDRDFLREWYFSERFFIMTKCVFTLKTTLRVLQLFLGLLTILKDSRERQANPDFSSS